MKRILVTGANKGVGFGIAKTLLKRGCYVLLGSRDVGRGQEAVASLLADKENEGRVELVQIDVTDAASIAKAAAEVRSKLGAESLYGLINNAGGGGRDAERALFYEVNTFGPKRVCDAFIPLLNPTEGRIVNISSAAGPMLVAKCTPERQAFFKDPNTTWEQIEGLINKILPLERSEFEGLGLSDWVPEEHHYGLSKALLNNYTMFLGKQQPNLKVWGVTPGFIHTDLTQGYLDRTGKTAAEMGMKGIEDGAFAPVKLMLDEPAETPSGYYFGSDCVRSPLDKYRGYGDPPYTGP